MGVGPVRYCSPKGRLLAVFFVCRRENEFLLSTHESLADSVIARLRKYVIRAEVSFESLTDQHVVFHDIRASGSDGSQSHSDSFSPQEFLELSTIDAATLEETASATSFQALCIEGLPISAAAFGVLIPQFKPDLVGGVSFKKGCYPGQEIVARVRYRGKPKQRMIRVIAEHAVHPKPGAPIAVATATSGRDGVVICGAPANSPGGMQLLAAVPVELITSPESGNLFWEDIPLTVSPLPYLIPTEVPG